MYHNLSKLLLLLQIRRSWLIVHQIQIQIMLCCYFKKNKKTSWSESIFKKTRISYHGQPFLGRWYLQPFTSAARHDDVDIAHYIHRP